MGVGVISDLLAIYIKIEFFHYERSNLGRRTVLRNPLHDKHLWHLERVATS